MTAPAWFNPLTAPWRKSSKCGNATCVQIAPIRVDSTEIVAVRGTASASALLFTADEWDSFIEGVKAGEFDHGRLFP